MKATSIIYGTVCIIIIIISSCFGYDISDDLLDAIKQVESGDDLNAIGNNGELGAYQISQAYWIDACEYGGVNWDYIINIYNDIRCRQVIRWYSARYKANSDEQVARLHNGGPKGFSKCITLLYWQKVEKVMQQKDTNK